MYNIGIQNIGLLIISPYSVLRSLQSTEQKDNIPEVSGVILINIEWIFFDIGSTLIDETAAYDHRAREMIQKTDVTFDEFDSKRIELAKQGFDGNSEAIKYYGLAKTPWHSEDEVPFDDASDTLKCLKSRGYSLGVIANQMMGATKRLSSYGLLQYLDVVVTSAELGISKPNKLIFEKACELAKCSPHNAVMVGDRLDNDIRPAKSIGMKTIWLRKGLSKYQDIKLGKNIADWVINNLLELIEIFG